MEKLLNNITETTRKVWRENEEKIFAKYGEYRYRLVVNGLGVVEIIDLKQIQIDFKCGITVKENL